MNIKYEDLTMTMTKTTNELPLLVAVAVVARSTVNDWASRTQKVDGLIRWLLEAGTMYHPK